MSKKVKVSNPWDKYTKEERATYVKAIKKLNERMRDLERRAMTDTVSYQRLSEWLANAPNTNRSGNLRAIQTYKLTPAQVKRLLAISSNKRLTAGGELERARQHLINVKGIAKPSAFEIKQQAIEYGKLESFVRTKLDALYEQITQTEKFLTKRERKRVYKILSDQKTNEEKKKEKFSAWYDKLGRF